MGRDGRDQPRVRRVVRRGRAGGRGRARAAPAGRRPDAAACGARPARRRDARAAVRQVCARHGVLGRDRARCRAAPLRDARRASRRARAALRRRHGLVDRRRCRPRPRARSRGLPAPPGQGRHRPGVGRGAGGRGARGRRRRRRALRRRERQLHDRRRPPVPACDARPRVRPRAAVPHVRGVRAVRAATATARSCSTSRS